LKVTETQFDREALSSGLRLIGAGILQSNKGSRLYECIKCGHHQERRLSDVRKGNFRCLQCFDNELTESAEKVGLQILGKGTDSNYRLCKFIACSHQQEIQLVRIRDGGFHCQKCFDDKLNQEAAKAKLKIVGKGQSNGSRLYEFRCGHQQEIRFQQLRTNDFKCRQCAEDTLKKEAADARIMLVGKGRSGDYRTYKLSCGHLQEMQPGHVRGDRFRCKQCLDDKFNLLAANARLRLIGKGRNAQYRFYEFIKCGHRQELMVRNVASKSALCQLCLDNRFNQEAEKAGLRIVGMGREAEYRLYEFLGCKHQQELRVTHVRDRCFTCRICNPDAGGFDKAKPATFYVYNLESIALRTTGFGITNNETTRRTAHRYCLNQHGFMIINTQVWHSDHGLMILKLEGAVRRKFALDKDMARVSGFKRESTKTPFSEVCAFVDHWLAKNLAKLGKLSG
jgi:hypothetical protein